jgi:hypothetical protein
MGSFRALIFSWLFVSAVFVAIFFIILYFVIRTAISNSEMAKNIREIRKLLDKDYAKLLKKPSDYSNDKLELVDNFELLNVAYKECPACKGKLSPEDKFCSHCGITLE